MKNCLIIITTLVICGCGAALNPYKDDFSCPAQDKGKCIRVEGAYKESLQKKSGNILNDKENKKACEKCHEEAKKTMYPKMHIAAPVISRKQENRQIKMSRINRPKPFIRMRSIINWQQC